MRMRVGQREVAKGEAKAVTQSLLNSLDDGIGLSAVRAFVIAIFDQRDGRVYRPLNMIMLGSWEKQFLFGNGFGGSVFHFGPY